MPARRARPAGAHRPRPGALVRAGHGDGPGPGVDAAQGDPGHPAAAAGRPARRRAAAAISTRGARCRASRRSGATCRSWWPPGSDAEQLGDRVRTALGERADDLESVELLASTGYAELPEPARLRLGLAAGSGQRAAPARPCARSPHADRRRRERPARPGLSGRARGPGARADRLRGPLSPAGDVQPIGGFFSPGVGPHVGCDERYDSAVITPRLRVLPPTPGLTGVMRLPDSFRPAGAHYAHVQRHLRHHRPAPRRRVRPHRIGCRCPADRDLGRRLRPCPSAGRRPRLVQARGLLRGAGPGVLRLQRRRHRRPARADREARLPAVARRRLPVAAAVLRLARCATAATTSATSARCCPSSARSTTS